jgi:hypothetical protein
VTVGVGGGRVVGVLSSWAGVGEGEALAVLVASACNSAATVAPAFASLMVRAVAVARLPSASRIEVGEMLRTTTMVT